MIRSNLHHITFLVGETSLSCIVSSGPFCRIDTALHPVDRVQECSYFIFLRMKSKISVDIPEFQSSIKPEIKLLTQKKILGHNYIECKKFSVICLTYSCPLNLRCPFSIIYLPNSCEASSNPFFLPSNDE